ncbi:MAG: hypothetical protein DMG60_18850 [Acidobacteria bacterium]|nr:MAG: hypothetical protein DMG60_18850 [Acidobacteriota bacterium]
MQSAQVVRFATFEVDLEAGELRKAGLRLRFTGQPFQVLAILLEQPGTIVTREQLQKRLWPNTFVDVDHNLNSAINRIREALGDSAENPRFVETLPRRGYRFIAPIDCSLHVQAIEEACQDSERKPAAQARTFRFWALLSGIAVLLLAGTGLPSDYSGAR